MNTAADKWNEVRIGDLGEVFTGRTPSTEQPSYFGHDYPFITPGDMRQGKYARETQRSLSDEGAALLSRIQLPANCVCVSCIGWQMGEVIMTDKLSFSNQQINTIVPNNKVDPSFLYYSLRPRKQELLSLGATTGVRTPILNKSVFCGLKVKIPPLPVQRHIAGILSAYDELIENNMRRIKILEEMARSLYREWFVLFRFPGHEKIPLVDSPLGKIPKGWKVKAVKEILRRHPAGRTYRDADVSSKGAVPVIDQSTSEVLGFHDNEPDHFATSANPVAIFGDHTCKMQLLVTPFSVGPNVIVFGAGIDRPISYLFTLVRNLIQTQEYKRHWTQLISKEVIVADKIMTETFADAVQPYLEMIKTMTAANRVLRQTRDLLLPKLLSPTMEV